MAKPTIQDVADRAGVSKATVSAVLNDKPSVKESTREHVLEVIRQLSYRPSRAARQRGSTETTRSVSFLVKEIENPYYAEIVAGAEEFLRQRGYLVLMATSEGQFTAEQRIINFLRGQEFDGLLMTPVLDEETDLSHIFELKRRNINFVLLEEIRGVQASLVDVDNVQGSKQAVQHLIELGHSRIVHFAGPAYSLHSEQRVNGVRAAYSESHLVFSDHVVVPAGASLQDGYRAGLAYFRDRPAGQRPTAVTCYNDLVALGLCRALAELQLRIPHDLSVVGYDDLALLDYVSPALTSVRVPTREMGRLAAEMLHDAIENGAPLTPRKLFLRTELVIRGSTSSPRPASA